MVPPGGGVPDDQQTAADTAGSARAGLNWDLFQGPAARKPFTPGAPQLAGWYDYGGGNLSDWGVHLTDVMNWFMQADTKAPLLTSASAQYVRLPRDPELVPDSYAVTWQCEDFVATLSNTMLPGEDDARSIMGTTSTASAA